MLTILHNNHTPESYWFMNSFNLEDGIVEFLFFIFSCLTLYASLISKNKIIPSSLIVFTTFVEMKQKATYNQLK